MLKLFKTSRYNQQVYSVFYQNDGVRTSLVFVGEGLTSCLDTYYFSVASIREKNGKNCRETFGNFTNFLVSKRSRQTCQLRSLAPPPSP